MNLEYGQLALDELATPGVHTYDLGRILPLGRVDVQGDGAISTSIDGEVFGAHVPDASARYLRIEAATASHVRAYIGAGFVADRVPFWDDRFVRDAGWSGADGIFSFPLPGGYERPDASRTAHTLFLFGDTMVSSAVPGTARHGDDLRMINNSYAVLTGVDPSVPGALAFHAREALPAPGGDRYYWLQDGFVRGDRVYFMPLLVGPNPEGPEGFQFALEGVDFVEVPLEGGLPDFAAARSRRGWMYHREGDVTVTLGGAVLPYLPEAGYEAGDGYVYVYGFRDAPEGRGLCAARVLPDRFADPDAWAYYDGAAFVPSIAACAPLLAHTSCEMSVTPLTVGAHRGQFLAVFQYDTNGPYTAYALGASPVGPFEAARKLYRSPEVGVQAPHAYAYNAKAHPHLSTPHGLLVSYNVNTTVMEEHVADRHVYRPRFLMLRDTTVGDWDILFSDAYRERVAWFEALNPLATPGGTVLVGDSITQEYPTDEFFPGAALYNRGIGGDTTTGVLGRLRESVIELAPARALVWIGTNDLGLSAQEPVEAIAGRLRRIVEGIRAGAPGCDVAVLSVLPVNDSAHPQVQPMAVGTRSNERIAALNAAYAAACAELGARYVDVASAVTDAAGRLDLACTREGLHLSPEGYRRVTEVLRGIVAGEE